MLDTNALAEIVQEQIAQKVNQQVDELLKDQQWVTVLEDRAVKFAEERILGKFSNSSAVPELVATVQTSVGELFRSGRIPGISEYIDHHDIKQKIDLAVESMIEGAIKELGSDPVWLNKIETLVNQNVVQRTVAAISSIDFNTVIHARVDELMQNMEPKIVQQLIKPGIQDHAQQIELSVLDDNVVVENKLTANNIEVVEALEVKHLAIKGSINTDNRAWDELKNLISQRTLDKINHEWRDQLVEQVVADVESHGINFDNVQIDDQPLLTNKTLSKSVVHSSLQSLGTLQSLIVDGPAHLNKTVYVADNRLGINTEKPEMSLGVWDEEVAIIAGKLKNDTAYIGTARLQDLVIGVNRSAAITVDTTGTTILKKLRLGNYQISHGTEVPNYSGTKGDVVFNTNPELSSNVFAWICLGGYKWKTLRAVE